MYLHPAGPRRTVSDNGSELQITIPSRKSIILFLFLSIWLSVWVLGAVNAAKLLFSSHHSTQHPDASYIIVWSLIWYVAGIYAIYVWLWMMFGREIITASASALSLRREIFGLGRTRQYNPSAIKNLRIMPEAYSFGHPPQWSRYQNSWGITGGSLGFDYGSSTVRFAPGLNESEAASQLVEIRFRLTAR